MSDEARKRLPSGRHMIRSLKAKYREKRGISDKLSDWMTSGFGSFGFLLVNLLFFFLWIAFNTMPGINHFDPFPFGMLTTMVSLEAIILSIFVLISQNRSEKVDDLRDEIDLEVDLTSEKEVTKLIKLIIILMKKNGIKVEEDGEIREMLKPIDESKIEKALERQM